MKNKSTIILRALLRGLPVKGIIPEEPVYLAKRDDDTYRLCVRREKYSDPESDDFEHVFLPIEIAFDDMINICEKMSDEDFIRISADAALKDINTKNRN